MTVNTTLLNSKKAVRADIEQKLEDALSSFKSAVGEKKFKRAVRKAGKIFANRFSRYTLKENKAIKKAETVPSLSLPQ